MIQVIGGGLAGSEAAWQLAERGHDVVVHEMRPVRPTAAHKTDRLAELVCSNTFKSTELTNAHGLLKAEMRALGSVVLRAADEARVPAGSALAVDRDLFSTLVHDRLVAHPRVTVARGEVTSLPSPGIIATGPLTSDALAAAIAARLGTGALAFYDAIAPIVAVESVDQAVVFRGSRYGKETMEKPEVGSRKPEVGSRKPEVGSRKPEVGSRKPEAGSGKPEAGSRKLEADDANHGPTPSGSALPASGSYLNCPMSREQYEAFIDALTQADQFTAHEFDQVPYFEGCMPVEEMARRGRESLRFGPMKPVGIEDPRTARRPYAVVQLRQEDRAARMWNLVGFQTRLRIPEQQRVFRMIPGLAHAEFLRFGSIHRNSYVNSPACLTPHLSLRDDPMVLFAGQLTGVEGYTESTATGLVAARNLDRMLRGLDPVLPPPTTMLGALYRHLREADPGHFQPMNANFGLLDELVEVPRDKARKRERYAERALADLAAWLAASAVVGS